MADVEVNYKGSTIGSLSATGILTLDTAGTYLEDDVEIDYTSPGGGGGSAVEPNDVNFYDYDGTLLYSYSAADFANLSAMPANPSHSGLTAQGWNWTLADAKTQVAAYKCCDIGQMYTTSDGKTRIYIEIPEDTPASQMTFYVRFTQSVARGVTVNWGDDSEEETYAGTSASNRSHTYAATGKYTITLNVTDGTLRIIGGSTNAIYGASTDNNSHNRTRIWKVEIGDNVTELGTYAFNGCVRMQTVTIPKTVVGTIGSNAFYFTMSLRHVNIPYDITAFGESCFCNCFSETVSMPKGVGTLGSSMFLQTQLKRMTIPQAVTSIPSNCVERSRLEKIVIPSGVTSMQNYAYRYNYLVREIWVYATTPPTLGGSGTLYATGSPTIYVPYSADHSVLEAYKTATNWSTFADNMVEMSA